MNGDLQEDIFMEQPMGFEEYVHEDKVLKLHKSIYGLKQSARQWNKTANKALSELGFKSAFADSFLYSKREENGKVIYILLYVDDTLVAGHKEEITKKFGQDLNKYFRTKDLGNVSHYLGMQIELDQDGLFLLNQQSKIIRLLEDFGLLDAKSAMTPMETNFLSDMTEDSNKLPNNTLYRKGVGSLLYLSKVSRPDIAAAVGFLC